MKKNTKIEIKTKKIVLSDGSKARRLLDFSGLKSSQLPEMAKEDCHVDMNKDYNKISIYTYNKKTELWGILHWYIDEDISEEDFQKNLLLIKKAGENLRKANITLRELRKNWKGEEIFII